MSSSSSSRILRLKLRIKLILRRSRELILRRLLNMRSLLKAHLRKRGSI